VLRVSWVSVKVGGVSAAVRGREKVRSGADIPLTSLPRTATTRGAMLLMAGTVLLGLDLLGYLDSSLYGQY
jgi:hypothetical protein